MMQAGVHAGKMARRKRGRRQSKEGGKSTQGQNLVTDLRVQKVMKCVLLPTSFYTDCLLSYRPTYPLGLTRLMLIAGQWPLYFSVLTKTGKQNNVRGPAQPAWFFPAVEDVLEDCFPDLLASEKQLDVMHGTIVA
jgi:hypothetical protein